LVVEAAAVPIPTSVGGEATVHTVVAAVEVVLASSRPQLRAVLVARAS
jgi:hypothetical protein